MNEITRYIEATETTDYVLPVIQLNEFSGGIEIPEAKRYFKRAIHIGIDKGNGRVATLCGKHHNRNNEGSSRFDGKGEWITLDDVEQYPDITCGSCLRSMKALLKKTSDKPYMAIVQRLGQKIGEAVFHVKKEGSNSQRSEKRDIDPEPRKIDNDVYAPLPRLRSDNNIIYGCRDVYGSIYTPIVHAVSETTPSGLRSVCGAGNNLIKLPVDDLTNYPEITCPACAKLIRERFPEDDPEALNKFRDKMLDKYLALDHYRDMCTALEEELRALQSINMEIVNLEAMKNV